jgi:hypothetical protein
MQMHGVLRYASYPSLLTLLPLLFLGPTRHFASFPPLLCGVAGQNELDSSNPTDAEHTPYSGPQTFTTGNLGEDSTSSEENMPVWVF